ncbi:hypothetical protein O0I10_007386 [Lichtheimia ornata]|uniref:Uncharacterized protein n=1 Tax=Lichtheimia ornata TaxID=688661 RepID=A0AAD7V1Z8_9FUNG|nr:uncharacterized protein O0I10_007386 [Lichtheimia ornata]KAJ8656790.1 hypothetical protein O0I10_007386 [Lichtheimia ornata]
MQSTLEANRVSNWTVALMLGASAALRSGSQGGIVGELPFCDLVLTLDTKRITNGESGENVFYGLDTHWARMVIKSFRSRRLEFSYVLLDDKMKCPHQQCENHGCLMARDPLYEKRMKMQKRQNQSNQSSTMTAYGTETLAQPGDEDLSEMRSPVQEAAAAAIDMNGGIGIHQSDEPKVVPETGSMTDPTGDHSASIQPNMLYGLCKDYHGDDGDYKVIHKSSCIEKMTIDIRAIEFLSDQLRERLRGKPYLAAQEICHDIIKQMCVDVFNNKNKDVTPWDRRIITRVTKLMEEYPHLPKDEAVSVWNEAMDRIHSRIPEMLRRLGLETFEVEGVNYSIDDLSGAFLVYFGIKRAIAMSDSLYNDESLIFMGYNASTGHDVIRDLTEVPSQNVDGFSSRLVIESTSKVRVVEKDIEPSHIFRLAIVLDTVISVAIMLLTFIGPMLSMYGARLWTSSYRESYMRMGTTMRWSVSQVSMMHSGTARDDWMVCIKPVKRRDRYAQTLGFFLLSFAASVTTIILWPFFHPTLAFPLSTFSRAICIISCVVGVPWVILAQTVFKEKAAEDDDENNKEAKKGLLSKIFSIRSVHSVINIGFVSLLIIFAGIEVERSWLYLYVLEAIYAFQWLCGELTDEWVYESTALFMLGALSALRLTNLPAS